MITESLNYYYDLGLAEKRNLNIRSNQLSNKDASRKCTSLLQTRQFYDLETKYKEIAGGRPCYSCCQNNKNNKILKQTEIRISILQTHVVICNVLSYLK